MTATWSQPTTATRVSTETRAAVVSLRRLCIIVGVIGTAVSITGSWVPSLWGDEAASILSATRPLGSMFGMLTHVDAVHGTYYLGLHAWVALFGSSPFAVRVPSAFAIGVSAAAVTWLCGRFGPLWFAALGGILTAILPRLTYAGEEARSYAFAATIASLICVLLGELVLRRTVGVRWWVAYGVLLTVGVYVFLYLGLMALVVLALVLTTPHLRNQLRRWAIASASALVLTSPLIVLAALERQQISYLERADVVNGWSVLVQMWFSSAPVAVLSWALILVAVVLWIRGEADRRRRGVPWSPRLEPIAVAWLLLPMGILLAVSPVMADYTSRYGTYAAPAAAVLMAIGVRRIARIRWVAVVAVVGVVALIVPVWIAQRGPYAKNDSDWNSIAATISAHARPGDGIVFDESVRPSRRPRLALDTAPAAFAEVRDLAVRTPFTRSTTWHSTGYSVTDAAARGRFAGVTRVWVVEYAIGGKADTWGLQELRALGFHPSARFPRHRSEILLYER